MGGDASHKRGALFIGKADSHCVILLYCETLLQVLLGIYCKRFYWIPPFTRLLLFYVFEIGKTKSSTPSVLMVLTLNGLFDKNLQTLGFYFTPKNTISLNLPHPFPPICFFHYSVVLWFPTANILLIQVALPIATSHTRARYCNWKYMSEWSFFEIKNFYFSIKEISILKS